MLNKSNIQIQATRGQPDAETPDHTWRNLFLYLLGCVLSVVLVFWPWSFGSRAAWRAPAVVVDAGTVQKIRFVGGFGTNTQVDTNIRSWLVQGVTKWMLGTRLETRQDFFNRYICAVGTDDCRAYAGP